MEIVLERKISMAHNYDAELEELRTYKQDDHYHFSIPFEYIKKNYGNDRYDIAEAVMEVDVDWDNANAGYVISYDCPDKYNIDPLEGNGDIDEFYNSEVETKVLDQLYSLGIGDIIII